MDDLIKQGADAFRAGNLEEARKLLLIAVKQNPNSESAWGWLYNVTNNDNERIDCLKQMLRINPKNEKANQLLIGLTNAQSLLETRQAQDSQSINQQVPKPQTVVNYTRAQPVIRSKTSNTKKSRISPIHVGVLTVIALCIFGLLFIGKFFGTSNGVAEPTAHFLSAADVFEVSAVDVVQTDGFTVTSAVCESVSSERFQPSFDTNGKQTTLDMGQIVFHAFRLTKPDLGSEQVVLFASNHTAAQGSGLVWTINDQAKKLFPEYPDGSKLSYPITMDTSGAQSALVCAQQAGKSPSLKVGSLDVEAWRKKAIEKFGPEQINSDGSKDDYVQFALGICKQSNAGRETMLTNLGTRYEGSFQQFVVDTFCPYTGGP